MEETPVKLKPKEKEFARKLLINNENATQTVKEVYGIEDDNYAGVKGNRLLRNDKIIQEVEKVKETLKDALEKKGITAEKLAEKIGVLLEANSGDKPDYNAIDKGLNHAAKARGDYSDEEKPKEKGTNIYNFFFNKDIQQDVRNLEDKIKENLKNKNA